MKRLSPLLAVVLLLGCGSEPDSRTVVDAPSDGRSTDRNVDSVASTPSTIDSEIAAGTPEMPHPENASVGVGDEAEESAETTPADPEEDLTAESTANAAADSETPPLGPPWQRDFDVAQREALRTGKPIFVYFTKTY